MDPQLARGCGAGVLAGLSWRPGRQAPCRSTRPIRNQRQADGLLDTSITPPSKTPFSQWSIHNRYTLLAVRELRASLDLIDFTNPLDNPTICRATFPSLGSPTLRALVQPPASEQPIFPAAAIKMMGWWSGSGANNALDEQIERATSSSLYDRNPPRQTCDRLTS